MRENPIPIYQEIKPSKELQDVVHSFWMHLNPSETSESFTIFPDSFFKLIFYVTNSRITNYFMTGLWAEQKEVVCPPNSSTFGCRLNILAPEFLIDSEVASILNSVKQCGLDYLNINKFDLSDFSAVVRQWEGELLRIRPLKEIPGNKLRLSQLLYKMNGSITATEVSDQIYWTNRQINRYFNKYLGVSLKKYLNIQKCYESYLQIREGKFSPEKDFFDQAHFIREVKKHTGETPTSLYKQQNDRFIQLKNIQRE